MLPYFKFYIENKKACDALALIDLYYNYPCLTLKDFAK